MKLHQILASVAKSIIIATLIVAFSWLVREVTKGQEWVPHNVSRVITFVSTLPDRLDAAKQALERLPLVYVETEEDFEPVNELEEDVHILATYAPADWKRNIAIINLRTGEEVKTWTIDRLANPHNRIVHPVMLQDSSVIYALQDVTGLIKIDANGERLWKQDKIGHHHAINMGVDGTIWANTYWKDGRDYLYYGGSFNVGGRELPFVDNAITQLDANTGEILFHKSVAEILRDNELGYLLVKSNTPGDPLHINDVEPVLYDGPHFKKGDVFISGRSGSWILHYRPSTNEVIEVITGPFESQHDIDIESDSTITLFNNNSQTLRGDRPDKWRLKEDRVQYPEMLSELVRYELGSHDKFEKIIPEVFEQERIFSFTEGLHELLPDGSYFVEEQNSSVLWVLKEDKVLYRDVLPSHHDGFHHLSNWARVLPNPN